MSCWCSGSILASYTRGDGFEPFYCNDKYFCHWIQWKHLGTRMHSSRMCTVHWGGDVCPGGCLSSGVSAWGCLSGGVCPGGCVSAYGSVCPGGCLPGGVCQTPHPHGQNDRRLWKQNLSATTVADGKNSNTSFSLIVLFSLNCLCWNLFMELHDIS